MIEPLIQQIDNSWKKVLLPLSREFFIKELGDFLAGEMAEHDICPGPEDWFRAFAATPPETVKCVIIGQDPYMNGEAMGLSFSVKPGYKLTPSARNIVKELAGASGVAGHTGDFSAWAEQGVLMLNSCLTTRHKEAGAHGKKGWELLTGYAIEYLSSLDQPIVYLAWGRWAHEVAARDANPNHHVIQTSHPSPLAASRAGKSFPAFIGSDCFRLANDFLQSAGTAPIHWDLKIANNGSDESEAQRSLF